jgi:hypothetical protein
MKIQSILKKVTKKQVISIILAVCIIISFASIDYASANAGDSAYIVQGNTTDTRDCQAFDTWINHSSGGGYARTRIGYAMGNNSPQGSTGTEVHLILARNHNVLYWSSHGLRGTSATGSLLRSGPSAFSVATTLRVDGSNWQTTCDWKNSKITVAIFAACHTLDNTYGQAKFMARLLRASNLRVIAGYHEGAPPSTVDRDVVEAFFGQGNHIGVTKGESIRSSWRLANEYVGWKLNWAVMCYQSNNNQFYRMPNFPGLPYPAPAANSTVYRYWNSFLNGQIINPASAGEQPDDMSSLPLELFVSDIETHFDTNIASNAINDSTMPIINTSTEIMSREMVDTDISLDMETQLLIATDFVTQAVDGDIATNSIISQSAVIREEIDPEIGLVLGTEIVVGRTFCFSNHYNGIRIVNNFIKVGTDMDGVDFIINRWQNVIPRNTIIQSSNSLLIEEDSQLTSDDVLTELDISIEDSRFTLDDVLSELDISIIDIRSSELVYFQVSDGIYRLSYEIIYNDGQTLYIDVQSGSIQ